METENRMRDRIRRVLLLAGLGQTLTMSVMNELEGKILDLFRAYSDAPEEKKDEAYDRFEEHILHTLRERRLEPASGANHGGSSNAGGSQFA